MPPRLVRQGEMGMGIVFRFPHCHVRASSVTEEETGRSTCLGQSKSAGQRSENHKITSSYLRAVKVLASSSSRSKKRQSPAASLPIVERLTEREAAYADAQAKRLDRSSVSMTAEDSRKIPTAQAKSVGNFLLAQMIGKSDKSAMATVDQIRRTIRQALTNAGDSPIWLAKELERGRDYIRDFLEEKKASLDMEVFIAISERYNIPIKDLTPTKDRPTAIRKGTRPHFYLSQHMESRGLDDHAMAGRMDGITPEAVGKWRSDPSKLQDWQVAAILHALGLEDETALTRLPLPAKRPQRRAKAIRKRA